MKDIYRFTIFTLFFLVNVLGKAQSDIIKTRYDEKIICKITRSDSASTYFVLPNSTKERSLPRSEILSIEYNAYTPNPNMATPGNTNINEQEKHNFLYFNFGSSVPLYPYSSKDIKLKESGLANNGLYFGVSLTQYAKNGVVGFVARAELDRNSVDTRPLTNGTILNADAAYWNSKSLSGGLILCGRADFFSVYGRIMGGFRTMNSPYIYLSTPGAWVKQESANASAFTLSLGGGMSFKVTPGIELNFNADYDHAAFEFDEVKSSNSIGQTYVDKNVGQLFKTIFLSIGLGLAI